MELETIAPGSTITNLITTSNEQAREFSAGNVRFVPVVATRRVHAVRIWRALAEINRLKRIDCIASQNVAGWGWLNLAFAKVHRAAAVGQIHYDFFSKVARPYCFGSGWAGAIRYAVTKALLRWHDGIRVVAQSTADRLISRKLCRRVAVIPVSVSQTASNLDLTGEQLLALKPGGKTVLYVGRLSAEKNLNLWLATAKMVLKDHPDAEFVIVGSGHLLDQLKKRASESGTSGHVHFAGPVPSDKLDDYYRQASVFLLTSVFEGFGRVIVEAGVYGAVPVSTQTAGAVEIIRNKQTGFICPQNDARALAESVSTLLSDPDLRREMALAAVSDLRSRFDPARLRRDWVEFLVENCRQAR